MVHHFGANSPFRIRSYRQRSRKSSRIRTYKKQGRGGSTHFTAWLPHESAVPPSPTPWNRNNQQTAAAPPPYKVPGCAPSESQSVDTTAQPPHGTGLAYFPC